MSLQQEKSAELVGRLERLPFSRWHRNFFLLAFLGVMFDAADFALFGAALPPIAKEFGLGPAQAGLLATVGLIGAFLGALFWGTISDYIGRRTSFQATVGIFALFTGLVAVSWNVLSLGVFRFLSNFGLGGEVPVTLTLTSEFSPGRIRGRMTGTMMAGFPVGLVVAAALSLAIVPNFGWRALFIVGIVPAILLFFVRRYMPESVRYQLSQGKMAEAERTVEQIERQALGQAGVKAGTVAAAQAVPEAVAETGTAAHHVTVFELLAPGRRKRTILLWIVSFCFLWSSNGILFMLPTILTQRGIPLSQAHQLPARSVLGRSGRICRVRVSDRLVRPAAGAVSLLLRRRLLPPLVCGSLGAVDVRGDRGGRLGQSGRVRLDRHLCQRAAPDASARDRGRLVLRHRPDRLVSRARRGRLHACLRARCRMFCTPSP